MPIVDTPSIFQQRIVLVAVCVAIGAAAWWQNAGGDLDHSIQKFSQTPLRNGSDELDFTSAEADWSGLEIDSHGKLRINALTESALLSAVSLMHDPNSESAMTRMAFLLEKQFGANASQQIVELMPILKKYKQAERRWLEENGSKNPPPHAELFRLQDELLGEKLAGKMFSEQRRLLSMMQAIHEVRTDANLTEAEKEQALIDLQKTLPEEDASIE